MALDLNDVISEVLKLLGSEITRKDVSLEAKLETGLPRAVGERVQLQQLIFNLILNGIEAMDSVSDQRRILFVGSSRSEASGKLWASSVGDGGTRFIFRSRPGMLCHEPRFTTPIGPRADVAEGPNETLS
jgi:C4-dicarboxylate-specific signal transduction histidine kinase